MKTVNDHIDRIIPLLPKIMEIIARMHRGGGLDLTFSQYQALLLIHKLGECSINELSRELKIAQSTTSQLVDRLVKAHLVHRDTHSTDRRRMVVKLSAKGKTIMEKRTEKMRDGYAVLYSLLSEEDREKFTQAYISFYDISLKLQHALDERSPMP